MEENPTCLPASNIPAYRIPMSHLPTANIPVDVTAAAETIQRWLNDHPIDDCCDYGETVREFLDDLIA
jgi:hypothetical protein